jgi:O-antigen ligase
VREVSRAGADRLGAWCGWVLTIGLGCLPLIGWLGPRGLIYVGLLGLLGLPAIRIRDEDRPTAVVLLLGLVWAAMSMAWTPFHPTKPDNNVALKLALQLPLYWAAVSMAQRAPQAWKRRALVVFSWGVALLGVFLLADFATDAGLYTAIHLRFYGPIRHDIAEVAIGHCAYGLALLAPLGVAAAVTSGQPRWAAWAVGALAFAGVLAPSIRFGADAPVLAVGVITLVALAVWRWPVWSPRVLAAGAAIYWLGAPVVIRIVEATGRYDDLMKALPLSYSMRLGFWRRAVAWISDHPIRGWGLDSSRVFGPGIVLHPHDAALQVWLELGGVGAAMAATFWVLVLRKLERPEPDIRAMALGASAAIFLLFGAVNFGEWQEWWLALGAFVALAGALMAGVGRDAAEP